MGTEETVLDLRWCRIATLHQGQLHLLAPQQNQRAQDWAMIARLEAGRWIWLPEALRGSVDYLHSWRGQLLLGGASDATHDTRERALRVWTGAVWEAAFGPDDAAQIEGCIELMAGSDRDDLTVAGKGLRIGNGKPICVARWSGREWRAMGQGPPVGPDATLKSLVVAPGGEIYLLVEEFKPTRRSVLWRWVEPVGWRALPGGHQKSHMVIGPKGELHVAGRFSPPLVSTHCLIARWDGERWLELSGGLSHPGMPGQDVLVGVEVTALGTWRDQLVVGGGFRRAGEVAANLIALWDGDAWSTLGEGLGGGAMHHADGPTPVYWEGHYPVLLPSGEDTLYAIGPLDRAGSVAVRGLARWNGRDWENPVVAPSMGVNGRVESLAVSGSNLVAAGWFTVAGKAKASGLAVWHENGWSETTPPPTVSSKEGLVGDAGGIWMKCSPSDSAGVPWAQDLLRWHDNRWDRLTNSQADMFSPLYAHRGALYYSSDKVRRWEGTNVTELAPSPARREVKGLVILPDERLAAVVAYDPRIVVFEAGKWQPLGGGLCGGHGGWQATVAAVDDRFLYLGGGFTHFGSLATAEPYSRNPLEHVEEATPVVRWSEETGFQTLGEVGHTSGTEVRALVLWREQVFAGGTFISIAGARAKNIARWDGQRWHPMGSGVDGPVFALAVMDDYLYVGGEFHTVDGKPAENFARWRLPE